MPGLTRSGWTRPARPPRGGVLRRLGANEDGAVAVIVAIMMVVVLGMAALVIDIGGISSRKGMLQNAADAAAMALAQICQDDTQSTVDGVCGATARNQAAAVAQDIATRNVNDGVVAVRTADVSQNGKAVVVVASTQKDLFASVFGTTSSAVTATATAGWSVKATPLPLAYNTCELPAAASTQTQLFRSDALGLMQPGCGLLTGVLNAVVPGWMVSSDCSMDVSLIGVVSGVLSSVIPSQCVSVVQGLVGQRVLLPVYEHPLGNVVLGCVVGGLLGGLLLGQAQNGDCAVEGYAVVYMTGYDFQSVNANVSLDLLAKVNAGVSIGYADMPNTPNCATYNANLLGLGVLSLGQPLCEGIQGQFQGYVTTAQAASMQTGDVKLIA